MATASATSIFFSTEIPPWLPLLPPLLLLFAKLLRSPENLPPCPPTLPFIGNLHQLGNLPHRGLRDLSRRFGPVITVFLGSVRTVVVHSPETAEEVLKIHDIDCCTRPKLSVSKIFFYDGLDLGFTQWSDYYRDVRKLCVLELFSIKRAKSFGYVRTEELSRLVVTLSESADSGSPVDLSEMLIKYVANFTCRAAFGLSFSGSGIDNERFLEVFTEANRVIGKFAAEDIFPVVGWIVDRITGLDATRRKSFHDLDAFFQQTIDDHRKNRKSEEGREDLIDVLLKLQKQGTKLGSRMITDKHIKAILMDIFLAGTDTSSISIDWAMAELVRHPRILRKVQAEIRERVGDKGTVTYEDLEGFEYMRMVMKESWRLHAPGSILIPREAMTKFQINGYDIYPGTRIHVNVWAIGRSPDVWKEDPDEFIPERFVDSDIDTKGTDFELLPFGSGRRGCPAMYMGQTTVEYTLANLLYRFDWELPKGMKPEDVSIEEAPGLTIHRRDPLELIPVKP
ncbi:PREDICTED: cytochrome P450 71B6-like [Tarenaya hassleriana]|uniref:cytochrome P450 71B6-like n=1 Tax=Tarenaya hassleriana TaxID=28532 RepID=UPI00053C29C3|nr:PREDICTED: cytochrome P450 71B6-like [Tarenaya hassleriana]